MELRATSAQTLKAENEETPSPKPDERAEARENVRASEVDASVLARAKPVEAAEPMSGTEDETRKSTKARRKSSVPRKVLMPSDKEGPPARQRKSQRIRTAVEADPAKLRVVWRPANNSPKAKVAKSWRTTVKKTGGLRSKVAKRKGRAAAEENQDVKREKFPSAIPVVEKADEKGSTPDEEESSEQDSAGNEKGSAPTAKKKIIHKKRPCEVCGRCYNTFYMKVHMRKHTGEKPFDCKECARSFSTDSLLRTHVQRYHGNTDDLHCDVCKKVFASKGSLKIHRQIHSDEKPYKCHQCDKEFKQPGVLNEHRKTHNNDFPFICEVCGKRFKSKRSVLRHKESAHDGVKNTYQCAACGKIFHDKSSLWRHQKRHEQGYTKHVCEVCGKQFHERKVLATHMLIHENKKPYQCEVCSKQFRHYSVLKRHMCCHTGVKPFKCENCSRQFIHRVYMLRHKCSLKNHGKGGADLQPPLLLPHNDGGQPPPQVRHEGVVQIVRAIADAYPKDVEVFVSDLIDGPMAVEQIQADSDARTETNPKDVEIFVTDLLAATPISLPPPLQVTPDPGVDPTRAPLPQHPNPPQAQLHTLLPVQQHEGQYAVYPPDETATWSS